MTFAAKILADSISPEGHRLTTFEVTFPRIILAEFNTHRVFSRNSASSRAIPVERMLKLVEEDPYIPTHWGKNQKGMQAEQEVDGLTRSAAEQCWLTARDQAVERARVLLDLGIHKQITNRLLEPFMWHQVVVTATEWSNFFHLRNHKDAHPEIQKIARLMLELYKVSLPASLDYGQWHLPYVTEEDRAEAKSHLEPIELLKKVSVGRCAAISYMRQNLQEMQKDASRCDMMLASGHMSPFEHVARPFMTAGCKYPDQEFSGNFRGWTQLRKEIPNEEDILAPR